MSPAKQPEPPGWVGPLLNMPVHPFAARFPMLDDVELKELADDIKAHGLHQALVLDPEGQLLDGRNRLAACNLAGVAPTLRTWGGDPVEYILGANLNRRHLAKGQRAMLAVLADGYLLPTHQRLADLADVSRPTITHATIVRDWAPDLVDAVVGGGLPLNDAYLQARTQKAAAESDEAVRGTLAQEAPDIAALVDEGKLTVAEASAGYQQRREHLRRQREAAVGVFGAMLNLLDLPGFDSDEEVGLQVCGQLHEASVRGLAPDLSPARVARAARHLSYIADHYGRLKGARVGQPEESHHGT